MFDVMFHSEAQYEKHDSKVTVNHFITAQMIFVGTLGGGGPVGWPRMYLEMHLHLNSELASNEFLTEFAFKIRKMPSGFALVRQSREQATVGRTHASMRVGGHALPLHPLILKWLHPAPLPPPTHHHHHHYPSLPK